MNSYDNYDDSGASLSNVGLGGGNGMKITHVENPRQAEYTMCGLAFDAYDSGDHDEQITFAVGGKPVTCMDCRHMVLDVRKIRLGRMPTNGQN